MSVPEKPRLRSTVGVATDPADPGWVWLFDQSRMTRYLVRLPEALVPVLQLFNGDYSLRDIQTLVMRLCGGTLIPLEFLEHLVNQLDVALLLDSPRYAACVAELLSEPVRPSACRGVYAEQPDALRAQLDALFAAPRGPGAPGPLELRADLVGLLIPHMDYQRGGIGYAWAYRELLEACDAELFIVMGTSHYGTRRFILTRKHFATPLGVVETDQDFVQELAEAYGDGLFQEEVAHWPEHSIELQAVWLQHCLGNRRPFRIVPLLVGSFHDCIYNDCPPHEREDIYLLIRAMRLAVEKSGKKVCFIASGDLAHIGPKFGDPTRLDQEQLDHSRQRDLQFLQLLEKIQTQEVHQFVARERDQRRLCGYPALYVLLSVAQPTRGRLLYYDQYVAPDGSESVSYAALAFYGQ